MSARHPIVRDALDMLGDVMRAELPAPPSSAPRFECTCGYCLDVVADLDDGLVSIKCPNCHGVAVRYSGPRE